MALRLFQGERRSLFGEILDWMLTPLLLLWPISLALTWLVAQNIAGKPFDRALEYNVQALAKLVVVKNNQVQFNLTAPAREILRADDYMAKPFSLQELEARVRALIRRGMGGASSTIKHGPLVYDQAGRVATIDGQMVELSARELGLLEVLLQRAGRLVSKDQLVERLCEWGEEVSNNAIEVYIHRLRKKIEKGPVRIATVRGLGYCLEKIPG